MGLLTQKYAPRAGLDGSTMQAPGLELIRFAPIYFFCPRITFAQLIFAYPFVGEGQKSFMYHHYEMSYSAVEAEMILIPKVLLKPGGIVPCATWVKTYMGIFE